MDQNCGTVCVECGANVLATPHKATCPLMSPHCTICNVKIVRHRLDSHGNHGYKMLYGDIVCDPCAVEYDRQHPRGSGYR